MRKNEPDPYREDTEESESPPHPPPELHLRPSTRYRRQAWLAFQRALDPLAPPKPLRLPRRP